MLGQYTHTAINGAMGIWQGVGDYQDMRQGGHGPISSFLYGLGDVAAWNIMPGAMNGIMISQLAIPVMQMAHQVGTNRVAISRMATMPFNRNGESFADTEIGQQRRYAAVNSLNSSANVARSVARRMRG